MTPLVPGQYYHVYNRGVNRGDIFFEQRNYGYFLDLYNRYLVPVAETFAYCLLRNHFHFLVRIRPASSQAGGLLEPRAVSRAFNHWLAAYAKAVNKAYGRTGGLFQHHFGRLPVDSERYLAALVHYIHHNPQKHGFVQDFRAWPHGSYRTLISERPTRLERAAVLGWFGGREGFIRFHAGTVDEASVGACVEGSE
jgi:REP element-mobilizing transposase RayT